MALDDTMEDRLRDLLRDPGWSLPPWPDPQARIRKQARRQRARLARIVAGTSAIAAAVIVASVTGFQLGSTPSASKGGTLDALALPAVGASGFPLGIYPPALTRSVFGHVGKCPDPVGLEPPGNVIRTDALTVVNDLGRSFRSDLRVTDRGYWPQVQASWRTGAVTPAGPVRVLYSGPLQSGHHESWPANLSRAVRSACGNKTASDTWLIVAASAKSPALQSEFLLLDREGHVLVWNMQ